MARDLSWDWIGDAHERFSIGDQILVRVLSVKRESLENITIKADVKSVSKNQSHENLKNCRVQSKYAGKVTDVHKGVVYVRLTNGINAVAHSCYDRRMPGKKDDVSFAVTRIDEERGVAAVLCKGGDSLFKRISRLLKSDRGDISIFACFFATGVIMLVSFLILYASVSITCINIRNGAKTELNNLSASIYADTYRSQRESNFSEYLQTLCQSVED